MSVDLRPALVDTHAHLQDPAFADDLEAVLARAIAAGVVAMVCVGYDIESSRRAVALASRYACVWATVGVHPNSAGQASESDWDEIRTLAREPRVVGVGETGLDNYRKRTPASVQLDWLWRHLNLANELSLPVVIHNREASVELREVLKIWHPVRVGFAGVMHCFAADPPTLDASLAASFAISIAGPVTYPSADSLRTVASLVPSDRLVVETDCPYLPPQPHRGRRNEPSYVALTARFLAELRGEPFGELAARATATAQALFSLTIPPRQGARSH